MTLGCPQGPKHDVTCHAILNPPHRYPPHPRQDAESYGGQGGDEEAQEYGEGGGDGGEAESHAGDGGGGGTEGAGRRGKAGSRASKVRRQDQGRA
jgi:hypothetical protein